MMANKWDENLCWDGKFSPPPPPNLRQMMKLIYANSSVLALNKWGKFLAKFHYLIFRPDLEHEESMLWRRVFGMAMSDERLEEITQNFFFHFQTSFIFNPNTSYPNSEVEGADDGDDVDKFPAALSSLTICFVGKFFSHDGKEENFSLCSTFNFRLSRAKLKRLRDRPTLSNDNWHDDN